MAPARSFSTRWHITQKSQHMILRPGLLLAKLESLFRSRTVNSAVSSKWTNIRLVYQKGGDPNKTPSFPMRRLVVTGKDTPENLSLFFGQHNSVQEVHKNVRLEVLLRPPPGSPMYVLSTSTGADENCPSWTPREPSAAESVEIEEIRAMQEVIRSHMGARGVENISTNDMRDILVENFGNQWSAKLQTYQNAVNSMDQGVQV